MRIVRGLSGDCLGVYQEFFGELSGYYQIIVKGL